jgi:hypothetical protein
MAAPAGSGRSCRGRPRRGRRREAALPAAAARPRCAPTRPPPPPPLPPPGRCPSPRRRPRRRYRSVPPLPPPPPPRCSPAPPPPGARGPSPPRAPCSHAPRPRSAWGGGAAGAAGAAERRGAAAAEVEEEERGKTRGRRARCWPTRPAGEATPGRLRPRGLQERVVGRSPTPWAALRNRGLSRGRSAPGASSEPVLQASAVSRSLQRQRGWSGPGRRQGGARAGGSA